MLCEFCKQEYEGNYCPFCGSKAKEEKQEIKQEVQGLTPPKKYKWVYSIPQAKNTKKRDHPVF